MGSQLHLWLKVSGLRNRRIIFTIFVFLAAAQEDSCTTIIKSWLWNDQKTNLETCEPDINDVKNEDFALSYATDQLVTAFSIKHKKKRKVLAEKLASNFS